MVRFFLATMLALSVGAPCANAAISIVALGTGVGGFPLGANFANFNDLTPGFTNGSVLTAGGDIKVTLVPDGRVATLPNTSQYAAPYLSNGSGELFGDLDLSDHQDVTPYLTTGSTADGLSTDSVTLEFLNGQQVYMGLLWGSVDTNPISWNVLTFYNDAVDSLVPIGTVTGADVAAFLSTNPNGDQGLNGTYYVNIVSSLSFNRVVATSSQYAFEFDNVAYSQLEPTPLVTPAVPEPASLAIWGLGALGCAIAGYRRRKLA